MVLYETDKMQLKSVRVVRKNQVNEVYICQDISSSEGSLYTLIRIKDHNTTKLYLEIFEAAKDITEQVYIEGFSYEGDFCMVFPYKMERNLKDFYMGEAYTLEQCEEVCINLILACITVNLPYPILYLILEQGQINMAKDHSIYFGYQLDLTRLDKKIDEQDCVVQCARLLLNMLRPKAKQKAVSYTLLHKKIEKNSYHKFTELYKDIRIAADTKREKGILSAVRAFYRRNKDTMFKIFLYICIVLAVLTLLSFASQVIFGEVIWLKILVNGFKVIGTESLLQ